MAPRMVPCICFDPSDGQTEIDSSPRTPSLISLDDDDNRDLSDCIGSSLSLRCSVSPSE
jgi:hypothetical protein